MGHCSLQIVLHERLTDSEPLSRTDSMITFKLSRDRVFRQRVSIYIRHDLAAYLVDHCALHCSDLPIVGAVYRRAFHFIAADQGCGFAS